MQIFMTIGLHAVRVSDKTGIMIHGMVAISYVGMWVMRHSRGEGAMMQYVVMGWQLLIFSQKSVPRATVWVMDRDIHDTQASPQ